MELNFKQVNGNYEVEYTGSTGTLQILAPVDTQMWVLGNAGISNDNGKVYDNLENSYQKGESFINLIDMTGLTSVKIICDKQPIKAIIVES
jgi:hypothetical protein